MSCMQESPEDKFCRSICLKTGLFVGRAERNINEAYTFIIYISSEFTGTTYVYMRSLYGIIVFSPSTLFLFLVFVHHYITYFFMLLIDLSTFFYLQSMWSIYHVLKKPILVYVTLHICNPV